MDLQRIGLWTLGILIGAACISQIIQIFKGAQVVNVFVPDGQVQVDIPQSTFELDATPMSTTAPEEGEE